ncbi:peptidylprolyl isomerase [Flavobacterium croceum]|uniref:peptidylprolyl isomerase n=1 Tax=Flavobacterium croceum TaxID=370975 RepID=UPI0024A8404A|nr:peptidylprolyl isomerase [Flavobacterium croceum]
MAVLQKIRKRSGLLLLAIGFALLAFVVQDLFTKSSNSLSKDVGSINGKDIAFDSFSKKVANLEKSQQGMTAIQAANQVWDQEIAIALLNEEFEKAGITSGKKHIIDALSKNPQIGQNPMFVNEATGKFDIKKFETYLEKNPEIANMMDGYEKDAEVNSKYAVYNNLIRGGMYATTADGKFKYQLEKETVNFDYVGLMYSSVKDSDIKITDEDIVAYMQKHEKRFKSEGTREIEYVLIEDKASPADTEEAKAKIAALLNATVSYNKETGTNDTLPGFKSASNPYQFVSENSDKPVDTNYVTKQDLNPQVADKLYGMANGEIYGPYQDGNYFCITKMMGKKAGAKVKASHILIAFEGSKAQAKEKRTKEQAKAKAESLLAQAKANPQMFMMLALTNSEDTGSAQSGGDLGYFGPGQMVKPFNDFVFNNPVGSIGIVETEFGYHVINVTDKQDAVKLATLAQKIEPSQKTTDEAYTKATQFEMDATSGKDFAALAKKAGLSIGDAIKAKPMDEYFGPAGNQRQIVKWAYNDDTKIGDVKRFEVTNVGHVIARLKKVNEKGLMTAAEAKPMVEPILKNQKKAEKLMAKLKGSSLESVAKANNTTVQNAPMASIDNAILGSVGAEPKVVGTALGLAVNKISAPIEGNNGVYVVKTKSVTKAPKVANYDEYVKKVKATNAQASGRAIQALRNDADINDNRATFY